MASGDRPGTIVRRVRRPALLLTLFALAALSLLLALPPDPAPAAPETQWVLTQTLVNPEKAKLEFRGGGSDPEFFGEERFKGMVMIYKPSATSLSIKDRWQDRDYIAWDVTITCNFSAPETTLVPGKPYKLTAGFSHSGMLKDVHPGEAFFYYSPEFYFDPDDSFRYYPSDPNTVSSMTWSFTAPSASPGATMQIQAGLSNAPACTVIWKYEARAVVSGSTTTTTRPVTTTTSTITSSSSTTESSTTTSSATTADTIPRRWSDAEFEKRVDEMLTRAPAKWQGTPVDQGFIGVVIAATGTDDCRIYDYSGRRVPGPVLMRWIRLGDTLQTGPNGRMRVELCDRDDARNAGPTVINMSINSEMSFDSFETWDENGSTWISIIRGSIRTFFKGWGRDSSFSVRAGVVVCGVRGSDVIVSYDPEQEITRAWVHEGHMDVTSSPSGETKSLVTGQGLIVEDGELGAVVPLSDDLWGDMTARLGVEDMQPLSPEERAAAWAQTTSTTTATPTTAPSTSGGGTATTAPPAGQGGTGGQQPPTFTQPEFLAMKAEVAAQAPRALTDYIRGRMEWGYIGLVTDWSGEYEIIDWSGAVQPYLSLVAARGTTWLLVRIGDTIRTGADGNVRIELFDWDGSSLGGASLINMGPNTTVVFTGFDCDSKESTRVSLLGGGIRVVFRGPGADSSLNVRVGTALCGVRGSDVMVFYTPATDQVVAYVREGRLDVGSSQTSQATSLTEGQLVVVDGGSLGQAEPLSTEMWQAVVEGDGLADMTPLTLEQLKGLGNSGLSTAAWIGVGLAAAALLAAVGVGIYFLRRRRRAAGAAAPPEGMPMAAGTPVPSGMATSPGTPVSASAPESADIPARADSSAPADDAPTPGPSFCRDCGSPARPGARFCETCGSKL